MVKNPNWHEADKWATYNHGQGADLEFTENNTSWWSEQDLNPRPNYSATLSQKMLGSGTHLMFKEDLRQMVIDW